MGAQEPDVEPSQPGEAPVHRLPGDAAIDIAIFSFDGERRLRLLTPAGERLTRFMAKDGVFRDKVGGPLMRGMHHIPVDRESGTASFRTALKMLKGEKVDSGTNGVIETPVELVTKP